jgi:hypothetical protein
VLLLTVPAMAVLAAPGYFFNAHDARHSVFFLVEFDQAIRDGALWPVWSPDQAVGFGYPLWLLYAPLAYYVAEVFHLLGLGFTAAVKATWALGFLVGALGVYRLARRWWGPGAGLVASLAYTYAPYHLVQIYVRAALAEFIALAWFPWVLLAFVDLWEAPRPRRVALAGLALGALMLTHTVSTLIFVPVLVGFLLLKLLWPAIFRTVTRGRWSRPLYPLSALILGGLLAAIFLLPMLLERRYIVEAQWVNATYDYSRHFVYLSQFFNPSWGFGYSVEGPNDGMSFQLGLLPFIMAAVAALRYLVFGIWDFRFRTVNTRSVEALFLIVVTMLTIFAMTPLARPLWDALPLVGLIQFPWRLLAITTVTLALLAGASVHRLKVGDRSFLYLCALAIVLASLPYTRPELLPIRPQDESPLAVIEFELKFPDMRGMTRWAERPPADADSPLLAQYLAGQPLQKAAIVAGEGTIAEQRHAGASAYARVQATGAARLRFYTYYFPGWRAMVDSRPAAIAPDQPNGLIGLDLPPGEHEVRLRFGPTPVRRIAAGLSLAALAGVAALLWLDRRLY